MFIFALPCEHYGNVLRRLVSFVGKTCIEITCSFLYALFFQKFPTWFFDRIHVNNTSSATVVCYLFIFWPLWRTFDVLGVLRLNSEKSYCQSCCFTPPLNLEFCCGVCFVSIATKHLKFPYESSSKYLNVGLFFFLLLFYFKSVYFIFKYIWQADIFFPLNPQLVIV